jgi:hypothetical protein
LTAQQEKIVQVGVFKASTFCLLVLLLLTPLPIRAQVPLSPPEARSPLSEIAHDISTWFRHVTGTGPKHGATSSLSLPRPRPAGLLSVVPSEQQSAQVATVSNKGSAELANAPIAPKNKAPLAPVLIND